MKTNPSMTLRQFRDFSEWKRENPECTFEEWKAVKDTIDYYDRGKAMTTWLEAMQAVWEEHGNAPFLGTKVVMANRKTMATLAKFRGFPDWAKTPEFIETDFGRFKVSVNDLMPDGQVYAFRELANVTIEEEN